MRICQECGESFRDFHVENGTIYDFSRRKYCVHCRPITSTSALQSEQRPKRHSSKKVKLYECLVCSKPLTGHQRKFCSVQCKVQLHSSYPKQKDRAIIRKLRLIEIAGNACSICGYNKNISNFHFHHLDPSKKSFQLDARAISNHGWNVIMEEFAKCVMLCSNCHFELHHPHMDFAELKKIYSNAKLV